MYVTFNVNCICRVNDIVRKVEVSEIESALTEILLEYFGMSELNLHVFNIEYHNERKDVNNDGY